VQTLQLRDTHARLVVLYEYVQRCHAAINRGEEKLIEMARRIFVVPQL
jgi:hypothetical protein